MVKKNIPEGWAFSLDPFWDAELNEGKDWRELKPQSKKFVVLKFQGEHREYTHKFQISTINSKKDGKFRRTPETLPPHTWTSKKPFIPGENDLQSMYPEMAKELITTMDTLESDPSALSPDTEERALWKCENGHVWASGIKYRKYHDAPCPWCGVKDSFLDRHPEVMKIWSKSNIVNPRSLSLSIEFPIYLECENHPLVPYKTTPRQYDQGTECTICNKKDMDPSAMFIDLMGEWIVKEFIPMHDKPHVKDVLVNDRNKANWRCPYGKLWACTFAERWNGAHCPCENCTRDWTRAQVPGKL